jgi:hypothetical protein
MNNFIRPLAMAAGALWAASAHAGTSQIGNVYYEDIFAQKLCNNVSVCFAPSSATPAGVYLRMQHFYCTVATSAPASLIVLELQIYTAPPGTAGASLIKDVRLSFPTAVVDPNNNNVYNTDHDILLVTGPGRYVTFAAFPGQTTGLISLNCAITGDLIPLPQ